MKGNPRYNIDDVVYFDIKGINGKVSTKKGKIYIIDQFGTWDDPSDVSYDIMVENDEHKSLIYDPATNEKRYETVTGDCLYKHITEKSVRTNAE